MVCYWWSEIYGIYFWKLGITSKAREQNASKNNITLIISKNVTTIYDHQFDIIEWHN